MTIRVLFFASLAQRLETRELALSLPPGAAVAQALDILQQRFTAFGEVRDRVATAVNLAYVKPTHLLAEGDELALIPPVSGG